METPRQRVGDGQVGSRRAPKPVRRTSLGEEIADRLITSILNGKFAFGERLPAERDLARYLDIGRPTLREAIRILSAIGLVEVRHGEGMFVVDEHSRFVAKAFSWAFLLDARTIADVVDTRLAIESELSVLAAERGTLEDFRCLAELIRTMEESRGNPKRFAAADLEFHLTIARAADNMILGRLLNAIRSVLERWIDRALSVPSVDDLAIEQHRRIADGISARDPVRARGAMREHLIAMAAVIGVRSDAVSQRPRASFGDDWAADDPTPQRARSGSADARA
ncbi:MAG: FadR/GntR family transcriptional regulator [Candidatus Limnocylindria bacterium]